jgi:hypothetical protein
MNATRVANAIEELQDLDRTLAAEPDGITIAGRIHAAVFSREQSNGIC